jgi:hypothetical protein
MQYCDGLRGPLVIYDPHDPHKALYDVDNGTRSPFYLLTYTDSELTNKRTLLLR